MSDRVSYRLDRDSIGLADELAMRFSRANFGDQRPGYWTRSKLLALASAIGLRTLAELGEDDLKSDDDETDPQP